MFSTRSRTIGRGGTHSPIGLSAVFKLQSHLWKSDEMNYGLTLSALSWLVFALQVVCRSADTLPTVCNYSYPYITKESGPLNITVLTAKEPNKIRIYQRNESYLIKDDMCVDTLGVKLSFPCPYVCEQQFCFLTIQMAEISGVDVIYLYSNSYTHVGGVYRKTGMYARESYFDMQGPVVQCVNMHDFEIPWTVRKPNGFNVMSCAYEGLLDLSYANLEETTEPQTVTVTAFFRNEMFKGYSCWININDISVAVERFVLWLDAAYFEESGQPRNPIIGPKEDEAELSWNFVISTPDQVQNFTCLNHDGVKCAGVTEVQEPGMCQVENTEAGMKYAVTTSIAVNDFASYVCYLGEKASAQSVYKLVQCGDAASPDGHSTVEVGVKGSNDSNDIPTEVIEVKIAISLNGEQVALNDLGTHYLWLQNVQTEDVKCAKYENKFTCRLSPDNLKIYWMVANGNLHSIIDVLSVNETLRFTGYFGCCETKGFSVNVDGGSKPVNYFHVLNYQQDRLDTMAILSDLLMTAFSHEYQELRDFQF